MAIEEAGDDDGKIMEREQQIFDVQSTGFEFRHVADKKYEE